MNGLRQAAFKEIDALIKDLMKPARLGVDVCIAPPATLLAPMAERIKRKGAARRLALGGQDCHAKPSGAYTGDVAAEMLRDAGASYVILGHSERRADHGENDAMVMAKAEAAYHAGLTVIICVGETLTERKAGHTLKRVSAQLAGSMPMTATAQNTVIAYEPVWAIGTGLTPTLEDIAKVHDFIRAGLTKRFNDANKIRILYGGSVKPDNAGPILDIGNVNGALVGGASLKAKDFLAILAAL